MNRLRAFFTGREIQVSVCVLLLLALAGWTYGYYQFLRIAVFTGAAVLAWRASHDRRPFLAVTLTGLALLFNPFKIVHFHRGEWALIDLIAAAIFLTCPQLKLKPTQ